MSIRKKGTDSNPIAVKDRAETFAESDVTVTLGNGAVLDAESVGIDDTKNITSFQGKSAQGPVTDSFVYDANHPEAYFEFDHGGFNVVNFRELRINGTVIASESGYSDGFATTFSVPNEPTPWNVEVDHENIGDPAPQPPDITMSQDHLNGEVTVEWPQPNEVFRWDAATFNSTLDSGSVDVFIEESTDGGSTWETIAGPIVRGQKITAAPDSEVRFRVELSRPDVGSSTVLESIYRRWVV